MSVENKKSTNRLFVANWKMGKTFNQALDFCRAHKNALKKLSMQPQVEIVICPSFPALFAVGELVRDSMIALGAQTCSAHETGPYTGQVSAQSLKQVGCTYCIIGHSEQRTYAHLSNQAVADQAALLLNHTIEPIICIGETKEAYDQKQTYTMLEEQLKPIIAMSRSFDRPITVAYEPIWAIGTGILPPFDYLDVLFTWLAQKVQKESLGIKWRFLYGGSVSVENASELCTIKDVDGLLIGSASLDFQKFEKIVS